MAQNVAESANAGILSAAAGASGPNLHPDAIAAAAKVQSDQAAGDGRAGQSG